MNDLIDRQAAIDALNEQIEYCNKALGSFDISLKDEYAVKVERASLEVYKEQLENLPSAQPEIVRCGDCKYFKVEHGWNCASYPICEVSPQRIIMPDDYCSYAERRTDGRSDKQKSSD